MKELRKRLAPKGSYILGRDRFAPLVKRSPISIKHYETGATPAPVEVLERCRDLATQNGWKDLADLFAAEIAGDETVPATIDGKIQALVDEVRLLRKDLSPLLGQGKRKR